MGNKKGFTFVEVLVIVVLIAIISLIAIPSYKKGLETSKNNQARAKLVEIANAARMYNEDARGKDKVAGYFGKPTGEYEDPQALFFRTPDEEGGGDGKYAYLKDDDSFGPDKTYRGYEYYICTPNESDTKCGGKDVIAIMTSSSSIKDERYTGKVWKVSNKNPGKVEMSSAS